MTMTITEFCDTHHACSGGRDRAIATGLTTMAELWQREDMRPEEREWIATQPDVLTDRELRLYACWCVRQVWHLLADDRSKHAVEVAERHAMGLAGDAELAGAREAAREAARAAWSAREAAGEAAGAAGEAARAAGEAAREAWSAAREAHSRYLLENVHPNFEARKEAGV